MMNILKKFWLTLECNHFAVIFNHFITATFETAGKTGIPISARRAK